MKTRGAACLTGLIFKFVFILILKVNFNFATLFRFHFENHFHRNTRGPEVPPVLQVLFFLNRMGYLHAVVTN